MATMGVYVYFYTGEALCEGIEQGAGVGVVVMGMAVCNGGLGA